MFYLEGWGLAMQLRRGLGAWGLWRGGATGRAAAVVAVVWLAVLIDGMSFEMVPGKLAVGRERAQKAEIELGGGVGRGGQSRFQARQ